MIRGTLTLISRNIFTLLAGFLNQTLLMRHYSLSEWGEFVYLQAAIQMAVALSPNSEALLPRFLPKHKSAKDIGAQNALIRHAVLHKYRYVSILLLLSWVALLGFKWGASISIPAYAYILSLTLITTASKLLIQEFLVATGSVKQAGIYGLMASSLQLVATVISIHQNFSLEIYTTLYTATELIATTMGIYIAIKSSKELSFSSSFKPNPQDRVEYQAYLTPLYRSNIAFNIYNHGSKLILGGFTSATNVAIYNMAKLIVDSIINVFYAIPSALLPQLVIERDEKKAFEQITNAYRLTLILGTGIIISLPFLGVHVLSILGGQQYSSAYSMLLILSYQLIFRLPSNIMGLALLKNNRTDLMYQVGLKKILIDVTLSVLLILPLGSKGIAISNLVGYVIASLLIIEISRKLMSHGMPKVYLPLLLSLASCLAMTLISSFA